MADFTECPICADSVSVKSLIECTECTEKCCKECATKWFLDAADEPTCMFNQCELTRERMFAMFGKRFMTTIYKEHWREILFQREKVLFASTMPIVEAKKKSDKLEQELNQARRVYQEYLQIHGGHEDPELRNDYWKKSSASHDAMTAYNRLVGIGTNCTTVLSKSYFCPSNDCNGVIIGSLVCTLCNTRICKNCEEEDKDNDHECDENTLASVRFLHSQTKPCPRCKVPINKIEGCDQMFCTSCHVPYSWRSGKIQTSGFFHNPHYFKYLESGGNPHIFEAPVDNTNETDQIGWVELLDNADQKSCVYDVIRRLNHIQQIVDDKKAVSYENRNLRDRLHFMLKVIDKSTFCKRLNISDREMSKAVYMDSVFTPTRTNCLTILRTMCRSNTFSREEIVKVNMLMNDANFTTAKQSLLNGIKYPRY